MTNILKQFEKSAKTQFVPTSPDEYFALRLAKGLGELASAQHYAILASQYSQHILLAAYEKALGDRNERSPAKIFHECLAPMPSSWTHGIEKPKLMAIRIERRCLAMGVFSGTHLEGFRVRVLAANNAAAENTAVAFVGSCLQENDCVSVALEIPAVSKDTRRAERHAAVVSACRAEGVSVWEIPIKPVMESLSYPPPKSREEMRKQIAAIWPMTDLKRTEQCVLDAFALGLYVQTERLFGSDSLNGHQSSPGD